MNQSDHSNAGRNPDVAALHKRERYPKFINRIFRFGMHTKSFVAILLIIFIAVIYLIANKNSSRNSKAVNSIQPLTIRNLEVELLDGAGSMKVTEQIRIFLRKQGYDVVEMKKNNGGIVERTFVLDRSGNLDATRQLATDLGVPSDKVFQKIDRGLYVDVTITVGKDFSKLKAFQFSAERSMN